MTIQQSNLKEYAELSRSVRQLENQLAEAQQKEASLRKQVETYYNQLTAEFARRWPLLTVKQV